MHGDGGLEFGEICVGALSMELGKYGRFIMFLFGRRLKRSRGQATSLVYYKNSYFGYLELFVVRLT